MKITKKEKPPSNHSKRKKKPCLHLNMSDCPKVVPSKNHLNRHAKKVLDSLKQLGNLRWHMKSKLY